MSRKQDTVLVAAARDGSSEAFAELVDRYRAPVVRLAYRMTQDADEAKDIAQDAFLRAFRGLPEFRTDRPFARWLFVIARNASLDSIRRRKRTSSVDPTQSEDLSPSPEEFALRNDEAVRVREAVASLQPRYRAALELYYVRGLRYREIALELGIPLGTVKTYISRAKRKLREELQGDLGLAA
jgi:RNA polymerase sigma-70 factor (ECF subfamily)